MWCFEVEACKPCKGFSLGFGYHVGRRPLNLLSFLQESFCDSFQLAIKSHERVDLQALLVSPSCLEFSPGIVRAFLQPRPGYVHKVPTNVAQPTILHVFCPPSFCSVHSENQLGLLSIRNQEVSKALLSGVSLQEVCDVAG